MRQLSGDLAEEERNLNCTFVRVNFKESCVKMSGRMTEIPFSYTRDKASFFFFFILRKRRFKFTSTRTKKNRRSKKPPSTYCESSLSFILHDPRCADIKFFKCDE